MSNVHLSVDLGTTWTAAGLSSGGAPAVVPLGVDGPAMPSVVAVVAGEIVAGNAAVRAAVSDPASAAREFKRRLGDTAPIVLGGTPYGPETLMGHLLAHVVAVVTGQVGAPDAVTLTHPAVFGEYKLDLMREAARVAGLGTVSLLSEPEAAALHYAHLGRLAVGDTVAVYDFGGGTFDAAVVRLEGNGPRLLGRPEGLERLGGIDLDHAVLAHVDASLDGALGQLDTADPDVRRGLLALRQECVSAKEALSVDTEVSVTVMLPGLSTVVRVTRPEFESFVRPRLSETLGALDRAIASAGLTAGDLAGIVLVGGSSRIPLVVEQVGAHSGRPLLVDADPKLVVALGAVPTTDQPVPFEEDAMSTTTPPAGGEPASTEPNAASPKDPAKDKASAAGKGGAAGKERRTSPGQREPEKGGMSTAGKVAAGVAAAGLAGATAAFWRDDVEDALGLGDDGDGATPPLAEGDPAVAAAAEAVPDVAAAAVADESMDAFDAIAGAPPAPGVTGAPAAGGGGGVPGGAPSGAAPRPAAARTEAFDVSAGGGVTTGPAPRVAAQQGPAPQAPTPAAAQTFTPPPPPMADPTPGASAPTDPGFEVARAELEARLEGWQPPEGADAEEVAALRARLEGLLDRYEPRPGQSVDEAIAELRDEFELRIDNFAQDQKIDALVDQVAAGGGGMAEPDPEFESRRAELVESLANWEAPEGTSPEDAADIKAQLEALVETFQPTAGQSADDAMAALRAAFDDQVEDFVQDQKIDALVDAQAAMEAEAEGDAATLTEDPDAGGEVADMTDEGVAADPDEGGEIDPRVTMPTDVLTDDFDVLIADPVPGFAIGELDPTAHAPAPGDEDFSTPGGGGLEIDTDFDVLGIGDLSDRGIVPPIIDVTPPDILPADDLVMDDLVPDGIADAIDTLGDGGVMPVIDERLTTSIDDLVPSSDDVPSLVPDQDDDTEFDAGMTHDQADDPLSGI
jgi:actin-like ATPase involved in cell morphogenesis